MTIQETYAVLVNHLKNVYDNREAANIADWVFENVTNKRKIERIIDKDLILNLDQEKKLHHYTQQLLQHKPVQYVLNEAWFAGMKFYVDEAVLIPRPETEELVEWIVEENSKFKIQNLKYYILDIGTGSGCIPIALKKKLPHSDISAIDVFDAALEIAKRNSLQQDLEINFLQLDFLDNGQWKRLNKYDIIVSNPPYVKQTEEDKMQRNVLQYEPHLALFVPDEDPLIFYRKIALFAQEHLNGNGSIYLEINEALSKEVKSLFAHYGYRDIEIRKDMQGKERMVKATFY